MAGAGFAAAAQDGGRAFSNPADALPAVALRSDLVDGADKRAVESAHSLEVMGGQDELDAIADVEPLAVVVHLLSEQNRLAHEAPDLAEGPGMVGLAHRVVVSDLVPVRLAAPWR